ncbi:excalibur calcium-binding domain-containing protein [Dactylosporangium sp. AC04546]|uniref:excalibur calcium-binding domain-containing protein n=1 Tax=Dactylosporangium sp. AC04546 TaxID=2862460 RepID=UPI001EDFCF04|nr:excalibur calcium-binding domain-containing protein [Dactylosporangium sp. AC04546]WVK88400.1 excalibur calcium-binding domain-containing protein [Dactylosporangium sp. AC04546]
MSQSGPRPGRKVWIGVGVAGLLLGCCGAIRSAAGGGAGTATVGPAATSGPTTGQAAGPVQASASASRAGGLPPGTPMSAADWCARYIRAQWPGQPEFTGPDDRLGQAIADLTTLTDATANPDQVAMLVDAYAKGGPGTSKNQVIKLRAYITAPRLVGKPPKPDSGDGSGHGGGAAGLCFTRQPWVNPTLNLTPGPPDPRFSTCAEANAHGYGPYYRGETEYGWYTDRDGDGIVCERR